MKQQAFSDLQLIAVIVSGCTVSPNYHRPPVQMTKTWCEVDTHATTSQPFRTTTQPVHLETWWKTLKDSMLDSLIETTIAANLDLKIATARVREARAQRGVAAADLWPQVNASDSYAYRGSSLNAGTKTSGGQGLGKQLRNAAVKGALQGLTSGQSVTAQSDRWGQSFNRSSDPIISSKSSKVVS